MDSVQMLALTSAFGVFGFVVKLLLDAVKHNFNNKVQELLSRIERLEKEVVDERKAREQLQKDVHNFELGVVAKKT